jgi:hypothetical protein
MAYQARKGITLAGRKYAAGEVVPLADLNLPARLVQQLIGTRKVIVQRNPVVPDEPVAKPALPRKAGAPKKVPAKKEAERQPASSE